MLTFVMTVNSIRRAFGGALPLSLQQIYIFEWWINQRGWIDHRHTARDFHARKAVCNAVNRPRIDPEYLLCTILGINHNYRLFEVLPGTLKNVCTNALHSRWTLQS